MLSATYRQSSQPRADAMEIDPTNQLLWRMNPRRLDIEAYRDSLLQAAGKLDLTLYGPSQRPRRRDNRRTVYATISRGRSRATCMKLYDFPAPMQHSPMREPTLNPLQQLFVMNSGFVQEQAAALAKVGGQAHRRRATRCRRCTAGCSRAMPTADELALGVEYLERGQRSRTTRRRCSRPTR